jgi:hypothetical protein
LLYRERYEDLRYPWWTWQARGIEAKVISQRTFLTIERKGSYITLILDKTHFILLNESYVVACFLS